MLRAGFRVILKTFTY